MAARVLGAVGLTRPDARAQAWVERSRVDQGLPVKID